MYAFIPDRLEIADHPGIDVLPLNILFAKIKEEDGKFVTGSALYSPDMSTLQTSAQRVALTYRNPIDASWIVVIEYDTERKSWEGTKISSGKDLAFFLWKHMGRVLQTINNARSSERRALRISRFV